MLYMCDLSLPTDTHTHTNLPTHIHTFKMISQQSLPMNKYLTLSKIVDSLKKIIL